MALSDVLNNLTGARDALVTAINNKGGTVAASATLRQCADAVAALPEGGGSSENDPVFDGLIFYLSFDRWMIDSVNCTQATWSGISPVEGKNGLCGQFDGISAKAAIPRDVVSIKGKSEWSVAGWLKPEALTQTKINPVYAEWNESDYGSSRFSVQLTNDLKIFSQVNFTDYQEDVNLFRVSTEDPVAVGEWLHFAVVVNLVTKTMRLYINGSEVANATNASAPESAPDLATYNDPRLMHWGADNDYCVPGCLDEFAIWHRALSSDDVATLYNSGAGLFYENNTNSVGGATSADLIDLIERDITGIEIPEGTTEIGDYAFARCKAISTVEIPNGVLSIGANAFFECTALESISLPAGLTTIGAAAFELCSSLSSVSLPAGLTTIRESAFFGCSSLSTVKIPSSVTSIGSIAFSNCTSLTDIFCGFAENAVPGAPWGAPGTTTIHYNA